MLSVYRLCAGRAASIRLTRDAFSGESYGMSHTLRIGHMLTLYACVFTSFSFSSASAVEPLPDSYDLRNIDGHSFIGPVRDQGAIGSCYAFSALGAAESAYNLANGLYDENCVDFSESFIVWTMDKYYAGLDGQYGSNLRYDELQSLVDYGVCSEAEFPYTETAPTDGDDHMDAPRVTFTSWHRLPSYDVESMKTALSKFGALDVGLNVDQALVDYTGGILYSDKQSAGFPLDYEENALNHAVAVVGWNGDTETWIVRNSWGSTVWGEAGYGNFDYYANLISTAASYLVYDEWTGEDFSDVLAGETDAATSISDGVTKAYGYYEWGGNNASVSNTGSLTSVAVASEGKAFTYGMFLYGGTDAAMNNSGSISSSASAPADNLAVAYGMCLQGGSLTNSGSVSASATSESGHSAAYGIRYLSFDSTGVMANSGSVYASATGNVGTATGVEVNDAAEVINTGSIRAVAMSFAVGLIADECAEVVNSGSIDARVTNGIVYGVYIRDGVFINKTGATVSAQAMNGDSYGIMAVNADVHNDGTITGTTSSISDGTLSGAGSFVGNLLCENTVVSLGDGVGSIGSMSVSGYLEITGDLTVNLDVGNGKSDVLVVGGYADLRDAEAILNVTPVGYAAAGEYAFITSNGASGSFMEVNTPAVFEGSVSVGSSGFTLDLLRNSYSSFSLNKETDSMAEAMDAVRPTATGNLANMLNTIDTMEEDSSVQTAVADLFPAMNSTATFAALGGLRRTGGYIDHHYKDGIDTGDGKNFSAWFEVMNSRERRDVQGVFPGYDEDMSGIVAGADRMLGRKWTVGFAASNATQSLDAKGNDDSASIRTRRGYLYAMWDQNPNADGLYFTSSLGLGTSRINTTRSVDFINDTVRGRHGADNYSVALGTGYDFGDAVIKIRPFANAEYDLLSEKAYAERDTQGAAVSFDDNDSDSLSGQLGLSVSAHVNINEFAIVPEVRVYREHEFLDGVDSLAASFGEGASFTAAGRALADNSNVADVTLRVIWANRITTGVNYARAEYDDGSSSDSASAFVQVRF